eukprot:m.6851 g.6851  ORF g.6851 m.6851 type:complete len:322 (+) comp17024_c0_seq1:24-989(+)
MTSVGTYVAASGFFLVILFLLRKWMTGGVCRSSRRLDGKTVIVTGANTGIGKETAVDLVIRGARVIVACRSKPKGEAAVQEIKARTMRDHVVFRQLDLADLQSTRNFAKKILEEEPKIHILINNAGVMMCPYSKTKDGFETQIGVNHLGHFILTNLLLDRIKASQPSRIINVSSIGYMMGKINFDDLMSKKSYSDMAAYNQSKLANILFTSELARRLEGTGVTSYSLHPGLVSTELQRHVRGWPILGYITGFFFSYVLYFAMKSPSEGAQTSIYCAVDEAAGKSSGKYYADCAEVQLSAHAKDEGTAKKLWEVSEKLTGLA